MTDSLDVSGEPVAPQETVVNEQPAEQQEPDQEVDQEPFQETVEESPQKNLFEQLQGSLHNKFLCPTCRTPFATAAEVVSHANIHDDDTPTKPSRPRRSTANPTTPSRPSRSVVAKRVSQSPRQKKPPTPKPPPSLASRWIPLLNHVCQSPFLDQHEPGTITVLCHPDTLYYPNGLRNYWSCGYRNLQSLLSSLITSPSSSSTMLGSRFTEVPDVLELQTILEEAWKDGFDPIGADQLNHKVVNTKKWIGTTEISSILHYMGYKTHVVDIHDSSGENGTHPELVKLIHKYFGVTDWGTVAESAASAGQLEGSAGATPPNIVIQTTKMPIYLQHEGHSRTVVGIQHTQAGIDYLLLYDPSVPPSPRLRSLLTYPVPLPPVDETMVNMLAEWVRMHVHDLNENRLYSVVMVHGEAFADNDERNFYKNPISTRL